MKQQASNFSPRKFFNMEGAVVQKKVGVSQMLLATATHLLCSSLWVTAVVLLLSVAADEGVIAS